MLNQMLAVGLFKTIIFKNLHPNVILRGPPQDGAIKHFIGNRNCRRTSFGKKKNIYIFSSTKIITVEERRSDGRQTETYLTGSAGLIGSHWSVATFSACPYSPHVMSWVIYEISPHLLTSGYL